jgi:hypothetical protein
MFLYQARKVEHICVLGLSIFLLDLELFLTVVFFVFILILILNAGRGSWSWSYGSWIYNNLCNQCLSLLKLWGWIPLMRGVLDTTLCDKVCKRLVSGLWFSLGTPVSSNTTDHHDIAEILLKVVLNSMTLTLQRVQFYSGFSLDRFHCSIKYQCYLFFCSTLLCSR